MVLSRYRAAREEGFRGGVRLLIASASVPITGLALALAFFAAAPAWFHRPVTWPMRSVLLYSLAGLITVSAIVWIAALFRRASWRGTAFLVWAGTILLTVVVLVIPEPGRGASGSGLGVLAVAVVLLGAIGWAFVRFDAPAT
jgi:hypothetical protein